MDNAAQAALERTRAEAAVQFETRQADERSSSMRRISGARTEALLERNREAHGIAIEGAARSRSSSRTGRAEQDQQRRAHGRPSRHNLKTSQALQALSVAAEARAKSARQDATELAAARRCVQQAEARLQEREDELEASIARVGEREAKAQALIDAAVKNNSHQLEAEHKEHLHRLGAEHAKAHSAVRADAKLCVAQAQEEARRATAEAQPLPQKQQLEPRQHKSPLMMCAQMLTQHCSAFGQSASILKHDLRLQMNVSNMSRVRARMLLRLPKISMKRMIVHARAAKQKLWRDMKQRKRP